MSLCLYDCLRAVGLQHHYASFASMGIHRAAHLSVLTMEDYPILGIRTMEDRTRLFHLVQLVKSLDLESLEDTAATDNEKRSCYHVHGEAHEDVYDDEDVDAVKSKLDAATFSKPPSLRRRLDFSSEMNDHHQKQFSCPADTVQICASQNGNHEPVQSRVQHQPESENVMVYCYKGNKHRPNVHSFISDNQHAGGITSPDIIRQGSMFKSCTESSPKCDSFHNQTAKTISRRFICKKSGHKENVSPQRKGIPQKTKPIKKMEFECCTKPTPVYESKRTFGYNYGLPQSSPPVPKMSTGDQRISVCVRKRPLTHAEKRRREADVVTTPGGECIIVHESKEAVDLTEYILQHTFYFDHVFGEEHSNDEVYQRTAYPLVQHMLNGGKATCFAYGQTGAGKTHTMLGSSPGTLGLYALAAQDIFVYISTTRSHSHLTVYVSYFEIYCGQLYDLLDHRKRLFAREDGQKTVHIAGLCHVRVNSVISLLEVISQGTEERTQGTSGINPLSSRSHALLQIQLRDPNQQTFGRMWFVDLAGSERASDSKEPDRQSRMEGAEINQSLLALKECIRSLDQKQTHTPFRQSKLTQVLKDSFVGDSMTCMIANISPGDSATEHTLNTLRYADRVKELRGLGGHRQGRRGKASSPKRNLSNSSSSLGGSSRSTRGKSPPKKPKLWRQIEAYGPITPTIGVHKGSTFLCSTPKNNRWGEKTSVRDRNAIVLEQITPIRGSRSMGEKMGTMEGEYMMKSRRENTERYRKGDKTGMMLTHGNDEQHLSWEVQKASRDGNSCLTRREPGFCSRELERQQGTSSIQGKEEMGQVESYNNTSNEVEMMREELLVKEKRHLRLYHQQLQQFMPLPASSSNHLVSPSTFSSSNQPSLTSSSYTSSSRHYSNLSTSPLRYDHLQEVLDMYKARVGVRAQEQECLQKETFPNKDDEGCGDTVSAGAEWRVHWEETEEAYKQNSDTSEKRQKERVGLEERDRKWAWVENLESERAFRLTSGMQNDVEERGSANCDSVGISGLSQEGEALAEAVWSFEDREEADVLGSTHNNDSIRIFNQPQAASDFQRAPAERPLSPVCEDDNRLLTLSTLKYSLKSKISNALQGVPSSNCGEKELQLSVNADERQLLENPVHGSNDSKAKKREKTGFFNNSVNPVSISMLQVDGRPASSSFLQGEHNIISLCSSDNNTGLEVAEDQDQNKWFYGISHSSTSQTMTNTNPTGSGKMKSSVPVQVHQQTTSQPLTETQGLEASTSPLTRPGHDSWQTSVSQSMSHTATKMLQYTHNSHNKPAFTSSASQADSMSTVSNLSNTCNYLCVTSPQVSNNEESGINNQQITFITHQSNPEDLDDAQWCVVQAHWEQLEEMEALTHKEGTLLCQQPDMAFGEYVHQLEVILERKAKCVHRMIAQLQPYLKVRASLYQRKQDDHNLIT